MEILCNLLSACAEGIGSLGWFGVPLIGDILGCIFEFIADALQCEFKVPD